MRGWIRQVTVLLVGFTVVPAGLAVGPLDDDAGSGGDAGDVMAAALPVEPGSWTGRFTRGADAYDWYAFDGRRGDRLSWIWEAGDATPWVIFELYEPGNPGARSTWLGFSGWAEYVLTINGTWHVAFWYAANAPYREVPYSVAFALEPRPDAVIFTSSDASRIVEVRWDEPADLFFFVRTYSAHGALGEPTASVRVFDLITEWYDHGQPQWMRGLSMGGYFQLGVADDVRVHSGSLAEDAVPGISLDLPATGWLGSMRTQPNVTGSLRLMMMQQGHGETFEVVVDVGPSRTWSTALGSAPVVVTTSDLTDEGDLVAPGLRISDGAAAAWQASDLAAGFLSHHAADTKAAAPDGTTFWQPAGRSLGFIGASPGPWNLDFAPYREADPYTEQVHFIGASFEPLGIAPPSPRYPA